MRSAWMIFVATALIALCGCGGSSSSTSPTPQVTIVSGNWGIALTAQPGTFTPMIAGGVINQSGTSFSGILHLQGSTCFDSQLDDLVLSGTLSASTITLTSAPVRGQVLAMSVTPAANQVDQVKALSGSWTITGGACAGSGTSLMASIPPLTGTWSGPITNAVTGTVGATLTQSGPDAHGFFQVSGSFAFSGTPCFTAGTIASSSVSGLEADIVLNTNDAAQAQVSIIHSPAPTADRLLTSITPLSTTCFGSFIQATLNKQ